MDEQDEVHPGPRVQEVPVKGPRAAQEVPPGQTGRTSTPLAPLGRRPQRLPHGFPDRAAASLSFIIFVRTSIPTGHDQLLDIPSQLDHPSIVTLRPGSQKLS